MNSLFNIDNNNELERLEFRNCNFKFYRNDIIM